MSGLEKIQSPTVLGKGAGCFHIAGEQEFFSQPSIPFAKNIVGGEPGRNRSLGHYVNS